MSVSRRWLRLDVSWSQSEWLATVEPLARLAWVELLCYVKVHGTRGTSKAISPVVASRMWGVGEASVRAMLEAAERHGALDCQEGWTVTKWGEYQKPDATTTERSRRYRESKSRLSPSRRDAVTDRDVTRDGGVTRRVTVTGTIKKNPSGSKKATSLPSEWAPTPEHAKRASELRLNLTREVEAFRAHAETHDRRAVSWNGAFATWLLKSQSLTPNGNGYHPPAVVARPAKGGGLYVGG